MTREERELLEMKFTHISGVMQANHDAVMMELGHIKAEAKKTNGRVTKIEQETKITRFFESKPLIMILAIIGVIVLISSGGLAALLKLF